jgi:hypothetical protein
MSRTRSARLLLASVVFSAGVALALSTAGFGAPAARTQQTLSPPTALWKAYPLRPAHGSANKPAADKQVTTGSNAGPTSRARPATNESRPPGSRSNRIASRSTSAADGVPTTVLLMVAVIGVLLASTLLFLRHSAPARAEAGGRTAPAQPRTSRPAPRAGRPPRVKPKPPAAPRRSKPVDTNAAEQPSPDRREATDDLLEALQPDVAPVEHPAEVSTPTRAAVPRPVARAAADTQASKDVGHAPQQLPEIAVDQYCRIRLWRGYFKCQFYAELEGSSGAFAESALFRLGNPSRPDEQVQSALEDLLAELERSGWSVVERGPVWYGRRLQRSLD